MSYDIYLVDHSGETIHFKHTHQCAGGTHVVGGTAKAWLNITYHYRPIFRSKFGEEGIRSIYGLSPSESIPILTKAIDQLGDDIDQDYWTATEGNAKQSLIQLRLLAQAAVKEGIDCVWKGD